MSNARELPGAQTDAGWGGAVTQGGGCSYGGGSDDRGASMARRDPTS